MNGRAPAPIATLLTSVFLLGLTGAACMEDVRKPASGGGGTGGEDEPGDTGGKSGGPAGTGGKAGAGTGGAVGTGGSDDTGGAPGTGGAKGTGGAMGTGGSSGKDAGADSGSASGDAAPAAPTFTEVYKRVMSMEPDFPSSSCWGPCHAGPGVVKAMQKIDMTTQAKAYPGVMKLVMPGNATRSKLWMELNTGAMPEKKPKLPASLIKLVADWINAGAKND